MPHLDEFRWMVQERKVIDFRGTAMTHLGNAPTLKLIQILQTVNKCDLLLDCREEIQGILNYLVVWKPDWVGLQGLAKEDGMEHNCLIHEGA